MGPRPFGRGDTCRRTACCRRAPCCFNGAATFRSRRCASIPLVLPQAEASMGPRPFGRGDVGARCPLERRDDGASMGPRPFGRGDLPDPRVVLRRPGRGFNGAATFRSRRSCTRASRRSSARCFNGAATFRSRRSEPEPTPSRSRCRFNGAATFRSRRSRLGHLEGLAGGYWASMGPRPFGRGDVSPPRKGFPEAFASMGPRPFGRGDSHGGRRPQGLPRSASMGPRPFGRGDPRSPTGPGTEALRGFNGAATFRSRRSRKHTDAILYLHTELQWGRDLSVAEIPVRGRW